MTANAPPGLPAAVNEMLQSVVVGSAFATTLYGITILQTYIYYRRYPNDSIALKTLVGVLFLLDSAASAVVAYGVYDFVILIVTGALAIPSSLVAEHAITIVVITITQLFFAQRIWYISNKNWLLVGSIVILSIGGFVTGQYLTAHMIMDTSPYSFGTVNVRTVTAFTDGLSAVCDILIAVGLCYYLRSGRSGFVRTNSVLDKLMVYAIQRGALTTVCQIGKLISFVAFPGHFAFTPFADLLGKFYCNTLLASLNVRHSLRNTQQEPLEPGSHILGPMPDMGHSMDRSATDTLQINITTVKTQMTSETLNDSYSECKV
ncbi:hypothetical protein C8Q76DRAFT_799729 [Earliella scabrosa]|nr:hypothetical protein C8Q76DRAFT_799729 [Earliella scabrosa]